MSYSEVFFKQEEQNDKIKMVIIVYSDAYDVYYVITDSGYLKCNSCGAYFPKEESKCICGNTKKMVLRYWFNYYNINKSDKNNLRYSHTDKRLIWYNEKRLELLNNLHLTNGKLDKADRVYVDATDNIALIYEKQNNVFRKQNIYNTILSEINSYKDFYRHTGYPLDIYDNSVDGRRAYLKYIKENFEKVSELKKVIRQFISESNIALNEIGCDYSILQNSTDSTELEGILYDLVRLNEYKSKNK